MPVFRCISLVLAVLCVPAVHAAEAPAAADNPVRAKSLMDAQIYALPQQQVAEYLGELSGAQSFYFFAGQNDALKAKADANTPGKLVQIGEIVPMNLIGPDIFADRFDDQGINVFLGAIHSADAESVRLRADLALLAPNDEVYVVDPMNARAIGPYTQADSHEDGTWLPLIEGDMAVVLVRSQNEIVPQITITAYSHGFRSMAEATKQASCNNLIACENDPVIQDRSSAIGRYVFSSGFSTFLCSGSLVNNATTDEFEPYFLTANHCVSTQSEANSVEVFWDYRVATCDYEASPPALNSLLRSDGQSLLATNSSFDYTLLSLDNVQSGIYGRTYLGWTTTLPAPGANVVGIHHPTGSHMRISYGDVTNTGQDEFGYEEQIRVEWFDGVTEGGSSGSPLMLDNGSYPVVGALSNGTVHVCPEDPDQNWDHYASFAAFYPSIEQFLTGEAPSSIEPACPAETTLKEHPELLKALRALRDSNLAETALGRKLIEDYYEAAPGLAAIVSQSKSAQGLFVLGAGPASQIRARSED